MLEVLSVLEQLVIVGDPPGIEAEQAHDFTHDLLDNFLLSLVREQY